MRIVAVVMFAIGIVLAPGCKKNRTPDTPAVPWGTTAGFVGGASVLSTSVDDPEAESVAVRFAWGDGDTSDWSRWTWPGDTVTMGHEWAEAGTFQVRAQAKSGSGKSSAWSAAHTVAVTGARIRVYGGAGSDFAMSAALTADGGLIVVGATALSGSPLDSIWLLRMDGSGDTLWTRTYGPNGSGDAVGSSVAQTRDGGFIVAGWGAAYLHSESDLLLIKTDASGNTVWTRQLDLPGSQGGSCVQQTRDNGYIIVGTNRTSQNGDGDIWVVKTDENGDTSWTKSFGGSGQQDGNSVEQTSDSGYIVLGTTWNQNGMHSQVMLTKTEADGSELWTRTYGGGDYRDWATSVRQTSDGGYILVGNTEPSSLVGGALLLKTDGDGNMVWQRMLNGSGGWLGRSVEPTIDGGYIIAGYAFSYAGAQTDAWLAKTDAVGVVVWDAAFGRVSYNDGVAAFEAPGGGYLVAGSTCPDSTAVSDVLVIKADAFGKAERGARRWRTSD